MKVFLAAVLLVAICVVIMCVGIFFGRKFPSSDVDDNEELRKRGISCYKHEDARLRNEGPLGSRSTRCTGNYSPACKGCSFFELENNKKK